MAYATNPGNLRLQLTDLGLDGPSVPAAKAAPATAVKQEDTELEIE
jgi:hypothetical protein